MKDFFSQKLTLIVFLSFFSFLAHAQFQKQVILTTQTEGQEEISFLIAADFTNDSIPEIIGRSFYSGTVYTLTQQADSSYGNGKVISTEGKDWSLLKAGDLNGDDFTDLIIYKDNGQAVWMQNDKQGGFLAMQILFEDTDAKFLHNEDLLIIDINNDGRDDIIERLPDEIVWYRSEGNTVSDKQTLLAIEEDKAGLFEKGQLAVSAINSAGYRELALLADGAIYTANDASGSFVWDQALPASETLQAGYILWADLDQDGHEDLVATDVYSWTGIYHLWYYDHDLSGKLNTNAQMLGETFLNTATMQYIWSAFPEDIDQDGDTDIFIQMQPEGCDHKSNTSVLGWLENQDDWSATAFHKITSKKAAAFADLDNDKDTDIILKPTIGEASQWLKHEKTSFTAQQLTKSQGIQGTVNQAILADIDQDTYQDIALSIGSDVVWLQGKQDTSFAEPAVLQSFAGLTGNFLEAANINQDKGLELILPYQGANNFNYIAYIDQDNSNSFISTQASRDEYPVFVGDVDKDGDPDILTAISEDEYAWFENREGAFKDYLQLGKVSTGTRLTGVMDIDGDGHLDILADEIWFKNKGDGNFAKIKTVGGEWAADIDGDGDTDILRSTSSGLLWHEQTSPGIFAQSESLLYKSGNFAVADMDGDGDPDIITYNTQIILWENNEGVFSETMVIAEAEVKTLAFADADHDTDKDIVATTENEVLFYRNPLRESRLPPQDILLSDTTIAENMPAGTVLAEISGQDTNNPLTFQLVEGEGSDDNASFEVKDQQLLTTAPFDFEKKSQYTIRLQATDTSALSFQKVFVIRVTDVQENAAPALEHPIDDQSIRVEQPYAYIIPDDIFTDADANDSLTYRATLASGNALPAWLSFNATKRSLSGTPQAPDTLNITIAATDIAGAVATDTFTLIIKTEGNSSPVLLNSIADQHIITEEDYQWAIPDSTFTDTDEDTLTITATLKNGEQFPAWLSFDVETRTFSGIPDQPDTLRIIITATDAENETASDAFYLFIETQDAENHTPLVSNIIPAQSTSVGQNFELIIPEDAFSDEDTGDSLTYAVSLVDSDTLPSWLTFDAQTRKLSGIASQEDSLSLVVTVSDMQGATASQKFSLLVKDPITGIDDPASQNVLSIYPNPVVHQQLFLEINKIPAEQTFYHIWNVEGKVIQRGEVIFHRNRPAMINLQSIRSGIYIVEIHSDSFAIRIRKRIVIQ